ncbi:MAG: hypothetical protein IPJ19_19640 [Planctomycetes bacterium]|nr:hypothetical protein [Planctomycetota bacterium]
MDRPLGTSKRHAQITLTLVFCAALLAPGFDFALRPASARSTETEGRKPVEFPDLPATAQQIGRFPRAFESAFSDSLGLRDHTLALNSRLDLSLWGLSPSRTVLMGKHGWMFYTGESSVETWRGLRPMDEKLLESWKRVLELRRDRARSLGAQYYFVIGPNKESIYPDYLPNGYEPLGPSRADQFVPWMQAHTDVKIIDLRPCMRAAREQDTPQHHLYYEEGTHWHGRGCMVAAREILRRIGEDFPALASLAPQPWEMESKWPAESWRPKMYLEVPLTLLRDDWKLAAGTSRTRLAHVDMKSMVAVHEQPARMPGLPGAVMFHDSFGPGVERILAEDFGRFASKATNDFDTPFLVSEGAQVVIDMYVERLLAIPSTLPFSRIIPLGLELADASVEAAFGASGITRLRCDVNTPLASLATSGRMTLETRTVAPRTGILLHSGGGTDSLILPSLGEPTSKPMLLRIEIDSPRAAKAELRSSATAAGPFADAQSVALPLKAGANTFWVRARGTPGIQRLELRPAQGPGTFLLRSLEMRAVPAP